MVNEELIWCTWHARSTPLNKPKSRDNWRSGLVARHLHAMEITGFPVTCEVVAAILKYHNNVSFEIPSFVSPDFCYIYLYILIISGLFNYETDMLLARHLL